MNAASHCFFWFRRDLRLIDNHGLFKALNSGKKVIPIFIFDTSILNDLNDKKDARVTFIYQHIMELKLQLNAMGSDIEIHMGTAGSCWKNIFEIYGTSEIYTNRDYEPYALKRDAEIKELCTENACDFFDFKDQVIFETNNVVKDDGTPYTVFTPYSKKWKLQLSLNPIVIFDSQNLLGNFKIFTSKNKIGLAELGFQKSDLSIPSANINEEIIRNYELQRDIPSVNGTSRLSVHLRFGTVSIRALVLKAIDLSEKWLNELIWREFYMQILWHFPHIISSTFKPQYNFIPWNNNPDDFDKWCSGNTGYPIVDAGMRELNNTGFMHNRVRMITASFLTKHLLIDWRWGEAYFAEKLLDFELSSNNGGWQWAAGCGVDAAPYFRIFNPYLQTAKFDPHYSYINTWVPEWNTSDYSKPVVDHEFARNRCLAVYKKALEP